MIDWLAGIRTGARRFRIQADPIVRLPVPKAERVGTEPPMDQSWGRIAGGSGRHARRLIEPPAVLPVARLGASSQRDGDIDGRGPKLNGLGLPAHDVAPGVPAI